MFRFFVAALIITLSPGSHAAAQPALPEGLGSSPDSQKQSREPALPEGLGGTDTPPPDDDTEKKRGADTGFLSQWQVSGFVDTRIAPRLKEPIDQEDLTAAETRAQVKAIRSWDNLTATIRADVLADAVAENHGADLNDGTGIIDLREANILWRPTKNLDIKAGRQILTWGTGDFLFLNDLFPKDFRSFFIGRRDTYLKAPSDAVKASYFSDIVNLDVVYTPQFDPDRFINGRRLSAYNPFQRQITGDDSVFRTDRPNEILEDDEWAARAHRLFGAYEAALYAYDGFWKGPQGFEPGNTGRLSFPKLSAYGASLRGPLLGGIGNIEFSYYDSRDDRGDDPNVPNSQLRTLIGYDRELITNLRGSVQYYTENISDYDALIRNTPTGAPVPDETRHLFTGKLVKSWPEEQVTATLFAFYSPSDQDGYIRPRLSWNVTDDWTFEAGANWLFGEDAYTQFGQLEDNSNAFVAIRYGF